MDMEERPDKKEAKLPWYYKPSILIIAILSVGVLALPLLWLSPAFKKWLKVLITVAVVALSLWMTKEFIFFYNAIKNAIKNV